MEDNTNQLTDQVLDIIDNIKNPDTLEKIGEYAYAERQKIISRNDLNNLSYSNGFTPGFHI